MHNSQKYTPQSVYNEQKQRKSAVIYGTYRYYYNGNIQNKYRYIIKKMDKMR